MKDRKHDLDEAKQQLADYIKQGNKDGVKAFFWLVIIVFLVAVAIAMLVLGAEQIDKVSTLIANKLCK